MKILIILVSFLLVFTGCQSGAGKRTAVGAGVGVAVGAGIGAIVGHQSGNRDKGALVGAAVGGLLGSGIGHYLDKQAEELARVAETRRTEQGIIAKLQGDILFDTNKSYLKPQAVKTIDEIAQIIVKYPEDRIRVVGHTDSTGSDELNARLSVQRAESVYNRLVKNGIPAQFIITEGLGELRPVASNANADGRAKNRRVELEITIDEAAYQKNH